MKTATSKTPNKRLSEDLTIVLLRGNGSPRSFRFSLDALNRALTAVGFTFFAAFVASIVFAALWFTQGLSLPTRPRPRASVAPAPVTTAPAPASPTNFVELPVPTTAPGAPAAAAAEAEGGQMSAQMSAQMSGQKGGQQGGLWQQLKGAVNSPAGAPAAPVTGSNAASEGELQKEVEGLRKDIAALGAKAEGRKEITPGNPGALLQFFGPRSQAVAEAESSMRIRNPSVSRDGSGRQIAVDFELHNVDTEQRQARGYIVVLAKTADLLVSYPNAVFAPTQNILLDYTKGETFAVSRFRQARATFPAAPLEGKRASYQIVLFATDGRVLANLPVEETRR